MFSNGEISLSFKTRLVEVKSRRSAAGRGIVLSKSNPVKAVKAPLHHKDTVLNQGQVIFTASPDNSMQL